MASRKALSPSEAAATAVLPFSPRQAGRALAHHLLTNQTLFMFVVLLVMMFGFAQLSPYFLTKDNLLQVTVQAAVICMLGAGQTFVILTAGIDLGVGSVLALVTVVSAIVMETWAGLARSNVLIAGQQGGGLIPGLVAGLLVGAACGLANGVVIGKLRVPPFVATLGMMGIARGLALIVTEGIPRFRLAPGADFVGQGRVLGIPVPTISVLLLYAVCYVVLTRTRLGRYTYAIGSNPQATLLSGVNIPRYLMVDYMISGLTAALAGWTAMSRDEPARRGRPDPRNPHRGIHHRDPAKRPQHPQHLGVLAAGRDRRHHHHRGLRGSGPARQPEVVPCQHISNRRNPE